MSGPPGLPLVFLPIEITSRVNSRMVKRYKDMRPPGHPGVRKLGFAELIVDSGAAWRELRMLVFLMALVVVSAGTMLVR